MNCSIVWPQIRAEQRDGLCRQRLPNLSKARAVERNMGGADGPELRRAESVRELDANEPLRFHLELSVHGRVLDVDDLNLV